ncbi:MAG: phosphotransferase [Gammaproteobacteria bacterium]|nr:phosphotransferase [Gammaproteobacteria bacterium]
MTDTRADVWELTAAGGEQSGYESRNRRRDHAEWMSRLADHVAEVERRWSLAVQEPLGPSNGYVARANREGGGEVVVKLGVPGIEFARELEALRLYGGRGAVMLLKAEPAHGSMMLESVRPGRVLSDVSNDEEATTIAASVMRNLWRRAPEQHPFAAMSEFEGGVEWLRTCRANKRGPIPTTLASRAEGLLRELATARVEPVLLHGDLHHDNILSAERVPWLAIDPKGVVGDPAYDVGPFLYNRLFETDCPVKVLKRRVDQMAEALGFGRDRIVGAAIPRAVLAAWPSGASGEPWREPLRCAELLTEQGPISGRRVDAHHRPDPPAP